jgi:hypothetical protein
VVRVGSRVRLKTDVNPDDKADDKTVVGTVDTKGHAINNCFSCTYEAWGRDFGGAGSAGLRGRLGVAVM